MATNKTNGTTKARAKRKTAPKAKAQFSPKAKPANGNRPYPQGNAQVTLLPLPKGAGANQQLHYAALKAVFGKRTTMALPAITTALAKAGSTNPRRTVRRVARAQALSWQ